MSSAGGQASAFRLSVYWNESLWSFQRISGFQAFVSEHVCQGEHWEYIFPEHESGNYTATFITDSEDSFSGVIKRLEEIKTRNKNNFSRYDTSMPTGPLKTPQEEPKPKASTASPAASNKREKNAFKTIPTGPTSFFPKRKKYIYKKPFIAPAAESKEEDEEKDWLQVVDEERRKLEDFCVATYGSTSNELQREMGFGYTPSPGKNKREESPSPDPLEWGRDVPGIDDILRRALAPHLILKEQIKQGGKKFIMEEFAKHFGNENTTNNEYENNTVCFRGQPEEAIDNAHLDNEEDDNNSSDGEYESYYEAIDIAHLDNEEDDNNSSDGGFESSDE